MSSNRASTSLRRYRHNRNPMQDFDRLPAELRNWVATAVLPWRAGSVRKAYDKALARTGDKGLALLELDRLQSNLISKDALQIWGESHPQAKQVS